VEREYKIESAEELEIKPGLEKIRRYTRKWIRRANRNTRNRFANVMKIYAQKKKEKTRKVQRREFWVLWERNWSTGGPVMMTMMNVNEGKKWHAKWNEWWLETEVMIAAAGTGSCCWEMWIVNLGPVRSLGEFQKCDLRY
jgi:hypothetical protein